MHPILEEIKELEGKRIKLQDKLFSSWNINKNSSVLNEMNAIDTNVSTIVGDLKKACEEAMKNGDFDEIAETTWLYSKALKMTERKDLFPQEKKVCDKSREKRKFADIVNRQLHERFGNFKTFTIIYKKSRFFISRKIETKIVSTDDGFYVLVENYQLAGQFISQLCNVFDFCSVVRSLDSILQIELASDKKISYGEFVERYGCFNGIVVITDYERVNTRGITTKLNCLKKRIN